MASADEPQKKRRKVVTAEQETLQAAHDFLDAVKSLRALNLPPQFDENYLSGLDVLAQRYINESGSVYLPEGLLNKRICNPGLKGTDLADFIDSANGAYARFSEGYTKLKRKLLSPSEYCEPSEWPDQQRQNRRLLCGRPTDQRGIPLSTLHNVFRRFIIDVESPLPSDHVANQAMRAAYMLCASMGDAFPNESARSAEFDERVRDLFSAWSIHYHISPKSEVSSGIVDRALRLRFGPPGVSMVFREDRNDIGEGGEVYIQVARVYDMYCKTITESRKAIGAPTFLACVMGPILIVSGAFFDGENVVIEPLTNACHMLGDESGRRQTALAKVLYALRRGIDSFKSLLSSPLQASTSGPSAPRLYLDCVSVENETPIGTLSNFKATEYLPRLLFTAILSRPNAIPEKVLVKLVSQPYGVRVQTFLAAQGYAPNLYGYRNLEGAPTAYVMEFLDSNWTSLAELAAEKRAALVQSQVLLPAIKATISRLTNLLSGATMVHGDIRPNNIMIRLGEDADKLPVVTEGLVELKVVDFDWAGDVGTARYPPQRNENIAGLDWPGRPGDVIGAGDDARVVDSWWRSFPPETVD